MTIDHEARIDALELQVQQTQSTLNQVAQLQTTTQLHLDQLATRIDSLFTRIDQMAGRLDSSIAEARKVLGVQSHFLIRVEATANSVATSVERVIRDAEVDRLERELFRERSFERVEEFVDRLDAIVNKLTEGQ